jgi:hypothetical protein
MVHLQGRDYGDENDCKSQFQPKLIGLYSPVMQSGKSEVALWLAAAYGATRLPFAGPLKRMARELFRSFGFDEATVDRMINGDLKEQHIPVLGTTPRYVMQTLGTEWGRKTIRDNLWADAALSDARRYMADDRHVVLDDMRFENEVIAITKAGGEIWKVVRPGAPKPATAHPSEGLLEGIEFDHVIVNDGTIQQLRDPVDAAFNF